MKLREVVERAERKAIVDALQKHHGRRGKAATELGITRKTLWEKMRRLWVAKEETTSQVPLPLPTTEQAPELSFIVREPPPLGSTVFAHQAIQYVDGAEND